MSDLRPAPPGACTRRRLRFGAAGNMVDLRDGIGGARPYDEVVALSLAGEGRVFAGPPVSSASKTTATTHCMAWVRIARTPVPSRRHELKDSRPIMPVADLVVYPGVASLGNGGECVVMRVQDGRSH